MAMKARHAFGSSAEVEKALQNGLIDAYDILFLDGDINPKVGWIDRDGVFRLVENEADFSELEAIIATKANASDVEALEAAISTKANAEDMQAIEDQMTTKADAKKVEELETALATKVTVDEVSTLVEEKVDEKVEEINIAYTVVEF